MMSVEQILIREFHLRFPNTKSIAASVNADDGPISVNVDGKEWIMNAAQPGDELVFSSGSGKDYLPISRRLAGGSFCRESHQLRLRSPFMLKCPGRDKQRQTRKPQQEYIPPPRSERPECGCRSAL